MTRRALFVVLAAAVLFFAVLPVALSVGAEKIRIGPLIDGDAGARMIFGVRAPRVILAALVGAILAMSGATYQTLLRNPLADPFVLGVSGGAACAAALVTLWHPAGPLLSTLAAFFGAAIATLAVFLLARRHGEIEVGRMIVAGLVLNSLFSAAILLALSTMTSGDLSVALRWMSGLIPVSGWGSVAVLATVAAGGWVALQLIAPDLRMLDFGEEDAAARGIEVARVRGIGYTVASLMTGAAVAMSGVIGFVGLLVPYVIRSLTRGDFRVVLPGSLFGGAFLLVSADAFARTVASPLELPVGALLAFLGAPFFVWVLRRR